MTGVQTCALPILAYKHSVALLYLMLQHRVQALLLAVKRPCIQHRPEHLLRACRVLDNSSLRRQVPPQDGNASVRADGFVVRADDRQTRLGKNILSILKHRWETALVKQIILKIL